MFLRILLLALLIGCVPDESQSYITGSDVSIIELESCDYNSDCATILNKTRTFFLEAHGKQYTVNAGSEQIEVRAGSNTLSKDKFFDISSRVTYDCDYDKEYISDRGDLIQHFHSCAIPVSITELKEGALAACVEECTLGEDIDITLLT